MKSRSIKKFVSGILSGILVILGFSACSSDDEVPDFPLMYGTLNPQYELKGKVVQKDNTEVLIDGIRVISYPLEGADLKELKERVDTVFTRDNGVFYMRHSGYEYYRIILEDVDGEDNGGTFKKDTIQISFDHTKSEDWEFSSERRRYQYQMTIEMEKETTTAPGLQPEPKEEE